MFSTIFPQGLASCSMSNPPPSATISGASPFRLPSTSTVASLHVDASCSSSKKRKGGAKVEHSEQSEVLALQREVLLLQRDNQIALKDVLSSAQRAFDGINSILPNIAFTSSEN